MRLLYFHQHFTTPLGSGGTRSYEMARAHVLRGHEVLMVCGSYRGGHTGLTGPFHRGQRRGNVEGIDVVELELSYSNRDSFLKRTVTFLRFALRSAQIAMTERYDLVLSSSTPLTAGIPGILARWLRGKPFVFEVRDLWPELPKAMGVIRNPIALWAMAMLEWATCKSAHRFIGLSGGIVNGIERLGVPKANICLVPNGCDLSLFHESEHPPVRPTGVESDDLFVIFAGTHGIANGLSAVLDAAKVLKSRGQEKGIKLVLIGEGKEKPDLIRRAQSEGLESVIFLKPVNKVQLSQHLKAADLGMQILANVPAFYHGTSPNKFFDYLASGLPVLCNYPGWISDLILRHNCGFVCKPGDPDHFADQLILARSSKSQLPMMGENSLRLARKEFDRISLATSWCEWVEIAFRDHA
jgi:glycosyltransferase involved in cell wall biosynthesis